MGSSQIDPSRNSSPLGPRRGSKAQNSLLNIIRIISTVPPEKGTPEPEYDVKREVKVFGIDLNVGFFAPPEAVAESEAQVEVDMGNGGAAVDFDGGETEKLCERSELSGEKGKEEEEEGFMGLLIEAARLIFGEFNDKNYGSAGSRPEQEPEKNTSESQNSDETKITGVVDEATAAGRLKRRTQCWAVELYGNAEEEEEEEKNGGGAEASPVVRSKRGRIQMLPCKYRDSVLEPLTRFTRTRSTTILANRRRSR